MKKKVALKLLFELIKNSKRSDRELAKLLRVSQPTITRMRQKLEKKTIREYTAIPDWVELGYEIIAFTFFNMGIPPNERQEETRKAIDWVMNYQTSYLHLRVMGWVRMAYVFLSTRITQVLQISFQNVKLNGENT